MTLIETLHEIAGQPLPPKMQVESVEPDEPLSEETGFELNAQDWETLKGIANGSITTGNDCTDFLAEAGLVKIVESEGVELELTPAATEWLGMLNDDHA